MLTLYHAPQSRSVRPRWMLEELGVAYELISLDLEAGQQKKPEYLQLNPTGTVPTLVDGSTVVWESAAIVMYLADKFPEKRLAPPAGAPLRGAYYQWTLYAMCGIEPPAVTIFLHGSRLPEAERIPQLVPAARAQLAGAVKVVDGALADRDYILGAEFSAADVMLGSTLGWCMMMGMVDGDNARVQAYMARLSARPAMQRAQAG